MKNINLENEYTFLGTLFRFILTWFILFLLWMFFAQEQGVITNWTLYFTLVIIGIIAFLYYFVWYIVKKIFISRRKRIIAGYAAANKLSQAAPDLSLAARYPFNSIAVSDIEQVRNYRSENHIYTGSWIYGDVSYDVMRQTKYGEYTAYTVHYAAMITRLPRELPNIFFDAKKSRGRQFRFHFTNSQKHSLEGSFDEHFVTYFPETYTIDSMSFITPDVMHALIDANQYDIEIKGSTLCIFGSLRDPVRQIPEMERLLSAIRKQLMDNILTYRDERVQFGQGRQTVAPIAMSLKRSKFWTYVGIAGTVLYLIAQFAVRFWGGD